MNKCVSKQYCTKKLVLQCNAVCYIFVKAFERIQKYKQTIAVADFCFSTN